MIYPKIGLTGVSGAGKTETLKKIMEVLRSEGYSIGGIITENILDKKKNLIGLKLVDVMTGEEVKLAGPEFSSKVKYDGLGINRQALEEFGVNALTRALEECEVIVIDEIGKFETESRKFMETVKKVLDAKKIVIITLHKKSRAALLQDIRRRDDIRILEVTPLNRSLMPIKVMKYIKRG